MEYAGVIILVIIALLFDLSNGMHDSANSIATVVMTRVMKPQYAIIMAGLANFTAFFLFSHEVAKTVGAGLINIAYITLPVIGATLISAICWNLLTWKFGLPSSSSHALFGGLLGAGVAHAGSFDVVIWWGWFKILGFMVLAPIVGIILSMIVMWIYYRIFAHISYQKSQKYAKGMQIFSALCYSIGHGGNDAQKTMGIIATILVAGGITETFTIPLWVAFACYTAIGIGTLLGGMKIIKTLGNKITKLHPIEGSAASLAGSIALFGSSALGVPVSTTHVITGAISGVGLIKSPHRVRWTFAGSIVAGWFLTIPAASILGAGAYFILSIFLHI